MGKVFRKIAKPIAKIIPKEIRPALPFIVPFIPGIGPALAGGLQSLGVSAKLAPLLARGIISSGTTALSDPNARGSDILRSGILSVAPQAISQGLGSLEQAGKLPGFMTKVGEGKDAVSALQKIQSSLQPETLLGKAGMVATQTGLQQAPIIARMNEQALRDYEAQLREQGIMDSAERRNKIFGYFSNAGYDAEEVNSFLDKYGYAYGGRVGLQSGGDPIAAARSMRGRGIPMTKSARKVMSMEDLIYGDNEDDVYFDEQSDINISAFGKEPKIEMEELETEEEKDARLARALRRSNYDLSKGLQSAVSGLEMAFGRPIDMKSAPTRFGLADGGIMNLGGREMDMRGGGFIPIGSRERADDVPARLSKNEFVMTADAVRAAGGGSINKGAKRMYDLMNKLEAKA